jgi:4-hydroxybenzoate polyprenyltransferase
MISILISLIRAARPIHWVKNLALFAALLFSPELYSPSNVWLLLLAFVAYACATSATYIFNDIIDAPFDRMHPIKRNRPIASGKLPIVLASIASFTLAVSALSIATFFSPLFSLTLYIYLGIQVLYSLWLKHISVIDILVIASGFVLRVYAGAFVIDAHLSVWFLLCVISIALFLASGKRRAEIGIVDTSKAITRKSLTHYSKPLLNSYVTMFGNAAWMSWALFTFFESPQVSSDLWVILADISRTTTISKLLMITIPVAIFGIMRYQSLIFLDRTEAPEKLLLTDKSLVISSMIWAGLVVMILYSGVSVY